MLVAPVVWLLSYTTGKGNPAWQRPDLNNFYLILNLKYIYFKYIYCPCLPVSMDSGIFPADSKENEGSLPGRSLDC